MSRQVIIEGSGRHIHVSREDLDILFGAGFELEKVKMLSQPGEFASASKVELEGPRGKIQGVAVLGPCRKQTQVEVSFTDARALGATYPVRQSGDLAGSSPIIIHGPEGSLELVEGAIIAKRHIHFLPSDAEPLGIKDGQIVRVRVGGERGLIFDEVVARVTDKSAFFMHLDYDEINAAALFGPELIGEILED